MKHLQLKSKLLLGLLILSIAQVWAQAPNKFSYQAVVRNAAGSPLANGTNVALKISIIDNTANGTELYAERHAIALNNALGLVNLEIGSGTLLSGSWPTNAQWSTNNKYVKVEVDITGGTSYTDMGTTQLLSVPYALNANSANTATSATTAGTANAISANATINPSQINNAGATVGQTIKWNGTEWVAANDIDTTKDNWGTQTAKTDATLEGDGTTANALKLAQQGATTGQVLKWNGFNWAPATDDNIDNWGSQTAVVGNGIAGNGTTANPLKLAQQAATNGQVLKWNGANWIPNGDSGVLMSGVGTQNYVPKFTATGRLQNSKIVEDANGRVGINSATPTYNLDISGNAATTVGIRSTNNAGTPSVNIVNAASNSIFVSKGGSTSTGTTTGVSNTNLGLIYNTNGNLLIETKDSIFLANNNQARIVVAPTGRVSFNSKVTPNGINYYFPSVDTSTGGNFLMVENANVRGAEGYRAGRGGNQLELIKYNASNSSGTFGNYSTRNLGIINNNNGSMVLGCPDSIGFYTNAVERFKIMKDGFVGVATSTPKAPLHISGRVLFDGPNGNSHLQMNSYLDGSVDKVNKTGFVSRIEHLLSDGIMRFQTGSTAASNVAGATVTLTNRMQLMPNGQLVLGTTSPRLNRKLYLEGTDSFGIHTVNTLSNGLAYTFGSNPRTAGIWAETRSGTSDGVGIFGKSNAQSSYGIGGVFLGGWVGLYASGNSGNCGIYANSGGSTYSLYSNGVSYFNGNIQGTGTNSYSSDAKLKTNIRTVQYGLADIMKLSPSSYEFKVGQFGDMALPTGMHHGLIAQELQKIMPELVINATHLDATKDRNSPEAKTDYLSVNYMELIPVLIKAIQEQQAQIEALKQLNSTNK